MAVPAVPRAGPKSVLVVGGGDGGVVREVLKHASVEDVTLCEIDGGVVAAAKKHMPSMAAALDDPRVTVKVRGARARAPGRG